MNNEFIISRLLRSKESVEEAKLLFNEEHYLTVFNRLYYAIFYVACAYLNKEQIITKTHSGTKSKFHECFVKTGIVNTVFGELYERLFRERNDSDYGDFEAVSKDDVEKLLNETENQLQIVWQKFEEEN